ncbi:glycosyltransferase family 4 protein [Treponema sp.]|uniref:glycosyltransferase family 4 protein n=1 Tax=Treponema sp. TaxID=166 RepID=UPI00388D5121
MKIGIDTFGLEHGKSGLGSYLLSLLNCFPELEDSKIELFGPEADRYTYSSNRDFEYEGISLKDNSAAERKWHSRKADKFCRKNGYDVVFYTNGSRLVPTKAKVASIAVVNSILSAVLAEYGFWEKKRIVKGLSSMDCIIASSMFVKKDLIRCGVKCPRIEIVHNGIDHSLFFPDSKVEETDFADIKPFAIKKPYIIYGSRMQSEDKKHVELIKAFTLFKEKTGLPHRLVLAGEEGAYAEEVQSAALESSAASEIFMTGFFPREGFPELYRNAEMCVFPSVNEGVGLPVLEAMATGIPVACAKAGALPEIAGSNVLYFDSDDIGNMAACIEQAVTDEKLREKLMESGVEWSKRFSWETTAEETFTIVKDVYSSRMNKG